MEKEASHNFHLPLPESIYRSLREEAQRSGRPATEVARDAIDRWLAEQRKLQLHQAVAAYATEMAGSHDDLDSELAAAALAQLSSASEPPLASSRKRKR